MKAILIDKFVRDLGELSPKEVPFPTPKGPRDVQIKITHAALTHVDMLYAQGLHQNNQRHMKPPFILGNEFAGVVTSSSSSSFRPGTRVFGGGQGSYAESISIDQATLRMVPEQWTNAEACAVGASGAISLGALRMTNLKAGESVLVTGASGGLGVMAIQIAKALGAKKVIALVGGSEKAEMLKSIGADGVVDYHEAKWEDKVKALTDDGKGVDVVYDAVGVIESGIKCMRYRGRIVVVGFAARGGKMEEVRANRILLKSVSVYGYRFGEDGRHDPQRPIDCWNGFMEMVDAGKIKPVIYKEDYKGLEDVPRALGDLKAHKAWGRAIVRINEAAETEQRARL